METETRAGHVGWSHFLAQRQRMLDQYDEATVLTRGKALQVYKGIVAEQVFRQWLLRFLPSRYGVTSGYIVPPTVEDAFKITHFDVIIFDKLNAPILWREVGDVLAIPVEFVYCVMEVKARLTKASLNKALLKLEELAPLLRNVETSQTTYKQFLPARFVSYCVFFESDGKPLQCKPWITLAAKFPRACPAVFIMRSADHGKNSSALARLAVSPSQLQEAHKGPDGNFYLPIGHYDDWNFQQFAFSLLARIEGRPDTLYPSFHALPPGEFVKFSPSPGAGRQAEPAAPGAQEC